MEQLCINDEVATVVALVVVVTANVASKYVNGADVNVPFADTWDREMVTTLLSNCGAGNDATDVDVLAPVDGWLRLNDVNCDDGVSTVVTTIATEPAARLLGKATPKTVSLSGIVMAVVVGFNGDEVLDDADGLLLLRMTDNDTLPISVAYESVATVPFPLALLLPLKIDPSFASTFATSSLTAHAGHPLTFFDGRAVGCIVG